MKVCEYSECDVKIENPRANQKYCCDKHRYLAWCEKHPRSKSEIDKIQQEVNRLSETLSKLHKITSETLKKL